MPYLLTLSYLLLLAVDLPIASTHAFGEDRPTRQVTTLRGVINTEEFFHKAVFRQEAVLLKGLYTHSRAFELWTDEYFLGLETIPSDHTVLIESRKKENRTIPPTNMHFQTFIQIYNITDQYMVESVPEFLQ